MEKEKYRLLLVEDDKLDQIAFKRLVEQEALPYDCRTAECVSCAKDILATEKFDIVITDYNLPDGTGLEVLDMVTDAPVILITGTGDEEIAIRAWKAGAYDYLIKDVKRNYLKAVPITVENAVRHSKTEAKLQLLSGAVTSANDSIYICDMKNKITFVNKSFCNVYGYSEEEILGTDANVLWVTGPQFNSRSVFKIVGSSGEVGFYHKRKDGSIFAVALSRSIIKDSGGKDIAVVGIARDISKQIATEEELREINNELAEKCRSKDESTVRACEQINQSLANLKSTLYDVRTARSDKISSELAEQLKAAQGDIVEAEKIASHFLAELDVNLEKTAVQG